MNQTIQNLLQEFSNQDFKIDELEQRQINIIADLNKNFITLEQKTGKLEQNMIFFILDFTNAKQSEIQEQLTRNNENIVFILKDLFEDKYYTSFEQRPLQQLYKKIILLVKKGCHIEQGVLFLKNENCFILNDKTNTFLQDFVKIQYNPQLIIIPKIIKMDQENCQIFVGKISHGTMETDLRKYFQKFGEIKEITLKRGFGFVEFVDAQDMDAALEVSDPKINGKRVIVEQAGQRKRRPPQGPSQSDKCFNCDRPGHWANECRKPKKDFRDRDRDRYRREPRRQGRSGRRNSRSSSPSRDRRQEKRSRDSNRKKSRQPSESDRSSRNSSNDSRSSSKSSQQDQRFHSFIIDKKLRVQQRIQFFFSVYILQIF